jgi:L-alanine-DL-glutamate epimerase-like enolase superfamily enzyme
MQKITDLQVWARDIPLSLSFPTSYESEGQVGEIFKTQHVFVRLEAGDLVGRGEGTELTMFTGGTSETMAEIVRSVFRPLILGLTLDHAFRVFRKKIMRHPNNPGAKLSVEMALYDLLSKKLKVPFYELFGRRMRDEIRLCYHIGALPPHQARETAKQAVRDGFKTLKLKADGDTPGDLERIQSVLEVIPEDGRLRVDANQGWEDFRRSGEVMRELQWDRRLEYIEQPVRRHRTEDLRRLSDRYGFPVYADESAFSPRGVMRLIEEKLVDGICLKVAKCGSLADGVLIASMAALHNVPITPVSAFATSLGTLAELHMCAVIPLLSSAVELCHYMIDDPAEPKLDFGPVIAIPDQPAGLNVKMDVES